MGKRKKLGGAWGDVEEKVGVDDKITSEVLVEFFLSSDKKHIEVEVDGTAGEIPILDWIKEMEKLCEYTKDGEEFELSNKLRRELDNMRQYLVDNGIFTKEELEHGD